MRDEEFIRNLSADLGPRKPIATSQMALLTWMLVSFIVLVSSAIVLKIRTDVGKMLDTDSFYIQLFSGLALGIIAAGIALHMRIPGARLPKKALGAAIAVWLAGTAFHGLTMPQQDFALRPALHCAGTVLLTSLIPGAILFYFVRRGSSTEPKETFAVVGLAMTAMSAAFLPLVCPNDSALHLLLGHSSPLFLMGLSGYLTGRLFLKW